MDNLKEKIAAVLESRIPQDQVSFYVSYGKIAELIYTLAQEEFNKDMQVVLGDLRRIRESIK